MSEDDFVREVDTHRKFEFWLGKDGKYTFDILSLFSSVDEFEFSPNDELFVFDGDDCYALNQTELVDLLSYDKPLQNESKDAPL